MRPSLCRASSPACWSWAVTCSGGVPGGQRAELQQRRGGGGAVEVPVGDDRAVVGSLRAAVVGVEVLDELGAGVAEGDGPGGGVAVGVAGVVEHVAERDAGGGHLEQHGDQGARGVEVAGAHCHAPGQLRDGRAVFLGGHGGGRQVVAEEHLAPGTGEVGVAVPPGGFGVGALGAAAPGRAGEGLHVGPVHRQRRGGVLVLGGDAGLQQVIADAGELRGGCAVGLVFGQGLGDQAEGVLGLPVGELVRAVLPFFGHAQPGLLGLGQRDQRGVRLGQESGPPVGQGQQHAQD